MQVQKIQNNNYNIHNTSFRSKLPKKQFSEGWKELSEYCCKNGYQNEYKQELEKLFKNGDNGVLGLFHLKMRGRISWFFMRADSTEKLFERYDNSIVNFLWKNNHSLDNINIIDNPHIEIIKSYGPGVGEDIFKYADYSAIIPSSFKSDEKLYGDEYQTVLQVLKKLNDKQSEEYKHLFKL